MRKSLNASANNTKVLFKKLYRLLGKSEHNLPNHKDDEGLANEFGKFFNDKVSKIRDEIKFAQDTSQHTVGMDTKSVNEFPGFEELTLLDTKELITKLPNKFCSLDPIPTFLLKLCVEELAPSIHLMINHSIQQNKFPTPFKRALVKPTVKDASGDLDRLANYRPVSNLPVLSKILEKAILNQLNQHLDSNNLHCPAQSGYRVFTAAKHS